MSAELFVEILHKRKKMILPERKTSSCWHLISFSGHLEVVTQPEPDGEKVFRSASH